MYFLLASPDKMNDFHRVALFQQGLRVGGARNHAAVEFYYDPSWSNP